jgi:hypothetical protein
MYPATPATGFLFCDNRYWKKVAERTGLEPATPGVTGRYSNQLNYRSAQKKSSYRPRRTPASIRDRRSEFGLVGADGIEPPTFAL